MENSSRALYMAGSLLISLLIISMLVYAFNNLGILQSEKDKIEYEESITAFNKEYEAFDNKIMYGTSVISCINKAISNDEKYIRSVNSTTGNGAKTGKWVQGNGASEEDAFVNVIVNLNTNYLEEKLEVYYFDGVKFKLASNEKYNPADSSFVGILNPKILTWGDILVNVKDKDLPKFSKINDKNNVSLTSKNLYDLLIDSDDKKIEIDNVGGKSGLNLGDAKGFDTSTTSLYTLMENVTDYEIVIQNPDNITKYESPVNRWLGIC